MTTNQTIDGVSRELLVFLRAFIDTKAYYGADQATHARFNELRALLDAPACKACNDTGKMHEPGQEPGECSACFKEPAAQSQGEPVHICQKCNGRGSNPTRHAGEGETEYRARCKLYAGQPAPVAVGLPVDPERERLMEIVQQYPSGDPLEYDAAVRTLRK